MADANVDQNAGAAPAEPAKKGYGKRPLWQWVLIYVVIGVIVYGVIFVLYK